MFSVTLLLASERPALCSSNKVMMPTPKGLWIRTSEALRPKTLCICNCNIITSAIYTGPRKHSIECVHPPQRCVTQRTMTDITVESETLRSRSVPGTLKTLRFFLPTSLAPFSSADHSWIFVVLERVGVLVLCKIFSAGHTPIRTQTLNTLAPFVFAMKRGVCQGCHVYKWLVSAVLPLETSMTVVSTEMCLCPR